MNASPLNPRRRHAKRLRHQHRQTRRLDQRQPRRTRPKEKSTANAVAISARENRR